MHSAEEPCTRGHRHQIWNPLHASVLCIRALDCMAFLVVLGNKHLIHGLMRDNSSNLDARTVMSSARRVRGGTDQQSNFPGDPPRSARSSRELESPEIPSRVGSSAGARQCAR